MLSILNKKRLGFVTVGLCVLGLAACSKNEDADHEMSNEQATPAPAPVFDRAPVPPSPTAEQDLMGRGRYLVETIVACGNCHSTRDDDGKFIPGMEFAGNFVIKESNFTAYAPNITPDKETGIGDWTDEELERAIRRGISRDGHVLGPPMAFAYFHDISTNDMRAIIAYIRAQPAVRHEVPKSTYDLPLPPDWGPELTSPIPDPPRSDKIAYGRYLAHNLGHCTQCHTPLVNGQEDFSRTGAGGNAFPMPFHFPWTAISANITSNKAMGLGDWTDDEIKRAITTGVSRDGRKLLPLMAFSFYAGISDEDLDAIIAYLRTLPPTTAEPPEL